MLTHRQTTVWMELVEAGRTYRENEGRKRASERKTERERDTHTETGAERMRGGEEEREE